MPTIWPVMRVIVNMPDVMPSRLAGTDPRIALLFGDWKTPIPAPITNPTPMNAAAAVSTPRTTAAAA